VGSGLRLVGPEDGAVAVQEDAGDFAGVEEARYVGVLQREGVFWCHGEVDFPDHGEEGWGSQVSCGDAQVGFHAPAEVLEAGAEEDLKTKWLVATLGSGLGSWLVLTPSSLFSCSATWKSNTVSDNGIAEGMLTVFGDAMPSIVRSASPDAASWFEMESTGLMTVSSSEAGVGDGQGGDICVAGTLAGDSGASSSFVDVTDATLFGGGEGGDAR
jgi:hypothetical protein